MISKKDKLAGINMLVFMSYFTKLEILLTESDNNYHRAEMSLPFMTVYEIITNHPHMPG